MECHKEDKFNILEGKLNSNNQITILKMTQIDKDLKDINLTLKDFIKKCDETYATKVEHQINVNNITRVNDILSRLNWILITAVCIAVLALILK